jgi:hypothetical protein
MRRFAFLPAVLVLVAACATSSGPAGSPAPTSTPVPSAAPSAVVTPSPSPVATPAPVVTPAPTPRPSSAMTAAEQKLVGLLRPDAAIDCVPRRSDLPEGTLRAIECRPDDPLVASVGVYWLPSEDEAAYTYLTRLASYGVDVTAGDCEHDIPGDAAWTPGDGGEDWDAPGVFNWENSAMSTSRNGCFRNENGIANVRVTCGNAYIGVLGTGKDLSDLYAWARKYPAGAAHDTPEPPGICVTG